MRIDHGVEIERGGGSEGFAGVNLQGVIVGGGEEGEGVKRVKGEMCDAEFVGGGAFVSPGRWMACVALQRIFRALKVPKMYRGGGAAREHASFNS